MGPKFSCYNIYLNVLHSCNLSILYNVFPWAIQYNNMVTTQTRSDMGRAVGVVIDYGHSGLFTILFGSYIFLAQNCIGLEPSP